VIVDSSALVAVLRKESGYVEINRAMRDSELVSIGAPTLVECVVVMGRTEGGQGIDALLCLIDDFGIEVLPFDKLHSELATVAFLDYGKGRHPARLNYGDCMTYAIARSADRPLLYTGDDFAQTDIQAA
jgi:ribonuclease VapC